MNKKVRWINFHSWYSIRLAAGAILLSISSFAQDLDPRAYVWVPYNARTVVCNYSFSQGAILTDPTLPIVDLQATVNTAALSYVHVFKTFGLTSQAMVAAPYSWANVSGKVFGQARSVYLSGLADLRLRYSILLLGAPAATAPIIMKSARKTILGVSVNIIAPTGEFNPEKLVNIGTNRFSFRPEIALSQPIYQRWLLDIYAGCWFFTPNNTFYPGNAVRKQDPMATFQAHISYNITPRFWLALNGTYYVGGKSVVDEVINDDQQNNTRVGVTAVLPIGKKNSIRLSAQRGAVVRIGQNFSTLSIAWQTSWLGK